MLFSQSQRGYLEVKGYVKSGNSFIEAVDVDVFQKGEKVQGILTKQSGHFNFILDLNYDYTVQFSKNGLVTKKVDIITNVPEVETGIWYYKFSIDLFPMIPELDISVLQKPVAKIMYDNTLGEFDFDEEYTALIKKEIDNLLKNYNKLKEKLYNQLIADADVFYDQKEYEKAAELYDRALDIDPYDFYPEDQLRAIEKILLKEGNKQRLYNKAIADGDKSFTLKEYSSARAYYINANKYLPDQQYPINKIAEIDDILNKLKNEETLRKEKEKEYNSLLMAADVLFNKQKYPESREKYSKALAIFPTEQYPKDQIAKIDVFLEELRKKQLSNEEIEKQYKELIAQADKEFGLQNLKESKDLYAKAMVLKTKEQYPRDQITEINRLLEIQKANEEKYKNLIAQGDGSLLQQKYSEARGFFIQAQVLKPNEVYPKTKIDEIDTILKNLKDADALYASIIKQADTQLQQKQLEEAKSNYQKGLEMKPKEVYPAQKIKEIDLLLAQLKTDELNKAEAERKYKELITKADQLYNQKQYPFALADYESALKLKPGELHPKSRIDEIKKILDEIDQKEKQYTNFINLADKSYKQDKLEEALPNYQNASNLKPEELYPKQQIADIEKKLMARKSEEEQRKALEESYNTALKLADDFLNTKQYPQAREQYLKASAIKPNEKYPKQKIIDIDKLLAEIEAVNKSYLDAISQADNNFNSQTYETSKLYYQKALGIKPNEVYPKQRITEIDQIVAALKKTAEDKAKLDAQYTDAIAKADNAFNAKQLEAARVNYSNASNLKPAETYPKQRIGEIDQILNKQKADKEAFDKAMTEGNTAFAQTNYPDAKAAYTRALAVYPNELEPKQKITEIDKIIATLEATEKAYSEAIAQADNLFNNRVYDNSKTQYLKASNIKPNETYPKQKIAEIDQIMATLKKSAEDKAKLDAQYNDLISNADKNFQAKQLETSRTDYLTASNLKPLETYPKQRIAEIDQMLAKQKADKEAFDKAMTEGNAAFAQTNYPDAKAAYTRALAIYPNELEPKQKIAEIDKLVANLEANEKAYSEAIAQADKLFGSKDYENAKTNYQKALALKPAENYPKQKISEIDQIVAALKKSAEEKAKLDAQYNELISKADKNFQANQLEASRTEYLTALNLKPLETYPKQRIAEIDQMLAKQKADKEAFDKAMTEGNAAFAQTNYPNAKAAYTRALAVYPNELEPKQKIAEIDKLVANLEANEKAYSEAIAQADKLFGSKDYENAKTNYQKALALKPAENYPKQKISEIDQIVAALKKSAEEKAKLDAQYNELLAKADKSFNAKQLETARGDYFTASNLKPAEAYPKQRITEIDQLLIKQKNDKITYDKAMSDGAAHFSQTNYILAKASFSAALEIYPNDGPAKQKLAETDKKIADIEALNKKFDELLAQADAFFDSRSFDKARLSYTSASELKPDETYPKQKIAEIDKIIEAAKRAEKEKQAVDKEYNEAITNADKLFNSNDLVNAKVFYQRALNVKPEEKYPKSRMSEIDQKLREQKPAQQTIAAKPQNKDDFDYNGEVRKAEFINELAKLYPEGVTTENYEKPKKKIKRVIVNRSGIAKEYIEVSYSYGTYYFRNGQNISKYVFLSETKE